jgi:acyl-CoA reductase-like NAD-dependent aldehyde dehydrogenase
VLKYETVEEAVDIANGTRYGLGASVFGPDQSLCLKVARRLECGMVAVNDFAVFYVSFTIVILVAQLTNSLPSQLK